MKKLLFLALLGFLGAIPLCAQTAVSGNLKTAGVVNVTSQNSFVRFTLTGYGGNIPRVTGTNIVASVAQSYDITRNGGDRHTKLLGKHWSRVPTRPDQAQY